MSIASVPVLAYTPPAYRPPDRDRHSLSLAARSPGNMLEGWPRAVFEADTWRPPFPGAPLFIMQPQAIHHVLLEAADAFPHGDLFARVMAPAWGGGLLTAQGADWRWQRHAAATAFRPKDLNRLTPLIASNTQTTVDAWLAAPPGRRLDMTAQMTRLTFDIILDTMLSGGEDFDRATMQQRAQAFFNDIGKMRLSYFLAPDAYHARRPDIASAHRQPLIDQIKSMVQRRRTAPAQGDLVGMLLAARDPETGQGMDDDLLSDNLMGFILAGHETTSLGLTWAMFLMASHPTSLARIRNEVTAVASDAPIGPEHIDRLVFTRQVVNEALRLYPPAFMITRVSRHDAELAGAAVRAGTRVNIPLYALHRHRRLWQNPDVFDPDRFAPDRPPPDRYQFLPLGSGSRICIGQALAMIEMVTILATIARSVDLRLDPGHLIWPVARLALRPKGGLPMTVSQRWS